MADKSALNSERMAWADGGRGLMEKGAAGEVSVAEEGDESESVWKTSTVEVQLLSL